MIKIQGKLKVERRNGSKGSFVVGDLITDIGEFKIKDTILDQYEPGEYLGTFLISKIYPSSYTWKGRVNVEIRASLVEVFIDDAKDEVPGSQIPPEPDPIDERTTAAPQAPTTPSPEPETEEAEHATPAPDMQATSTSDVDTELFGDEIAALIAERQDVKLDPTVDREAFRKQRDQLKAFGYRFDAKGQSWRFNQKEAI